MNEKRRGNASNGSGTEDEIYVDPNTKLTRKDISCLTKSLPFIKNKDCKDFTKKIICILKTEGTVDSERIKKIISNSYYEITGIHASCRIKANSEGQAYTVPDIEESVSIFFSKDGLPFWEADFVDHSGINVQVGDKTYTTPHEGIALGYFGSVMASILHKTDSEKWMTFELDGFASLAFVVLK